MRRFALLLPALIAAPALACPPAPGQFAPNCANNGDSVDGFGQFFLTDLSNPVPPGGAGPDALLPAFLVVVPPTPPNTGLALGNFSNLWTPVVNATTGPAPYQIAPATTGRPAGEIRAGDPVRDNRTGQVIGTVVNTGGSGERPAAGTVLGPAGVSGAVTVRLADGTETVITQFGVGPATATGAAPLSLPILTVVPPGVPAIAPAPTGPLVGLGGIAPPLLPPVSQPTVTGTVASGPNPTAAPQQGYVVQYPDGRRLIVDGRGSRIGAIPTGGLPTFDNVQLVGERPFNPRPGTLSGTARSGSFFWFDSAGRAFSGSERTPPPGTVIYQGAAAPGATPATTAQARVGTVAPGTASPGDVPVNFDQGFVDRLNTVVQSTPLPPRPPEGFRVPATADDRVPPAAAPPAAPPPTTITRANGTRVVIAPLPPAPLPGTRVGEGTLLVTAGGSNTQVPVTIVRRPDGSLVAVDAQGGVRGTAEERKAGPFGLSYKVNPLPSQAPVAPAAPAATRQRPVPPSVLPGTPAQVRVEIFGARPDGGVKPRQTYENAKRTGASVLVSAAEPSLYNFRTPTGADRGIAAYEGAKLIRQGAQAQLMAAVRDGRVAGRVDADGSGATIAADGLDAAKPFLDLIDAADAEISHLEAIFYAQQSDKEAGNRKPEAVTGPAPPVQEQDRRHVQEDDLFLNEGESVL